MKNKTYTIGTFSEKTWLVQIWTNKFLSSKIEAEANEKTTDIWHKRIMDAMGLFKNCLCPR